MEIAKSLHSPILLLLLLLLLLFTVDARSVGARNRHHNKKLLLNLRNLPWSQNKQRAPTDCIFQKPKVGKGATTLQMKERDDCSGKVIDWDENLQNRVLLDAIHVKALQSRVRSAISPNKPLGISESQIPISLGQPFQTLNYVVTVGIGGQNLTLIVDTGSDITWVQCRPCRKCYTQQEPIFDPSNSTSFLSVPCNSTTCSSLVYGHCAPGTKNSNPCNYEISYGDGSYSKGDFAFERLTLGKITVDNFIIGCGQTNEGLFGETSGLMGFDRDKLSIVSQTSSVFGGIFSYCLPATGDGTSGSLTMGGGDFSSFRNVSPISYTRMISNPEMPSFYLLNVTGISIGGVKLNTPRFASSGNGVTSLLDSGTTITRLPPSVYDAFKAEFEKQCPELQKVAGYSILEACYNLTEVTQIKLPSVKFYFEGDAVLNVDVQGILYFLKSDSSQTCLAFARLSDEEQLGIIGSYQQKNQRVLYNTQESKVGFAVETCSF